MCLLLPVCGSCSLTEESLCQLAELPSLRSTAALCSPAKALQMLNLGRETRDSAEPHQLGCYEGARLTVCKLFHI